MTMTARTRKAATEPAEPVGIEQRIAAIEAENTAIARAICRLAVKLPGGNADITRILQHEVGMSIPDADLIVAAAQRRS
jgi:hypothetical protein